MSAKKVILILSLIILVTSICTTAKAVTLNQRPANTLKSTFALEGNEQFLNFNPNLYRFLIYDTQGYEDSIQQAMQILGITYDLRNRFNPVTLEDLQTHDVLIVGWNVSGNTNGLGGLTPSVLASGITGRILLSGHDADYHTVNGPEAGKTFLSQAIEFVLAGGGTGLITLGDTDAFSYLPSSWGISVVADGSDTITAFTAEGLASGVYDGLTPIDMCNWGTSYHDKFTAWGPDFVSFELGGTGEDVVTIARTIGSITLTKVDNVNDGDCVGPGREITYTIDYSYPARPNLPDINDVDIIDYLPAEVDYNSASGGGSYDSDSHTVTWNIGVIHPGDAGSVTLIVKVKCAQPGSTITNECEIRSSGQVLRSAYEYTPVCVCTAARDPYPEDNATNVHYKGIGVTLGWTSGDLVQDTDEHRVYFGMSFSDVNNATTITPVIYRGVSDVNSFTLSAAEFDMGITYYWRIDEVNNANVNSPWKGPVWKFTTHDGKAYNPKPINAQVGLSEPLQLSWTAGDWAQSTHGHKVYFSADSVRLNPALSRPTDNQYRGYQTGTTYSLANLAGDWTLVAGNTYYWCVDEVNGTTTWKGPVWSFTPADYVNIDDFEDYNSTDDVNANWLTGYEITYCGLGMGITGEAGLTFVRDADGKHMQFTYTNSGSAPMLFSETKRSYSGGTSFTGNGVISPALRALRIDYRGAATNAVDPVYDRMYVALEDTMGNVAVYYNPDSNAAQVGDWTSWYIALYDINAAGAPFPVNLSAVSGFTLGFGLRCNFYEMGGGDGNVMFDNIRLFASTCVPQYGPTADLDGDCDVDDDDLALFFNDWLLHAEILTFDIWAPHQAPILWYKFNESGATNLCADSGIGDPNDYTGTVTNFIAKNWSVGGGRDGNNCLYLPPGAGCYVNVPCGPYPTIQETLGFMGDANHNTADGGGISFSVWINADLTATMLTSWNGLFSVWNSGVTLTTLEVYCPGPTIPTTVDFVKITPLAVASAALPESDFFGRWNHFAFTKSANEMIIYCNGVVVGDVNTTDDADVYGPLFDKNVGAFRIGTLGGNWGMWSGYIDDFQIYDYCLSTAEVAYLASDGSYCHIIPMTSIAQKANLKSSIIPGTEIIDFQDFAVIGQQWRTEMLWP